MSASKGRPKTPLQESGICPYPGLEGKVILISAPPLRTNSTVPPSWPVRAFTIVNPSDEGWLTSTSSSICSRRRSMRLLIRSLAMTMGIILRQSELRGNRLVINEVVPNSAYFTGRSVVQRFLSQKWGIEFRTNGIH